MPFFQKLFLIAAFSGLALISRPYYWKALDTFLVQLFWEKIGFNIELGLFGGLGAMVGTAIGASIGFIITYLISKKKHGRTLGAMRVILDETKIEINANDFGCSYSWQYVHKVRKFGRRILINCVRPGSITTLMVPISAFTTPEAAEAFYKEAYKASTLAKKTVNLSR